MFDFLVVDFKGLDALNVVGCLVATNPKNAGQDNVFVSLDGLPKKLYGKVRGLDVAALLATDTQHSGIPDIEI